MLVLILVLIVLLIISWIISIIYIIKQRKLCREKIDFKNFERENLIGEKIYY